ncbi:MAG: mannose-1-phosphate guanylyltransferase [Chloroflexi bacterium]|nr:mannose-1-phosphate guanylyltransferase [Chloroflexota bacterium]
MSLQTIQSVDDVYVCILAGGSGTRLWPLSRQQTPKQLLNVVGNRSMLQQTIDRVLPLVPIERILVLTDPEHVDLIAAHLPELPKDNIYCEPSARGTAPALGLTAFRLRRKLPGNAVMVSLHADHIIQFPERFRTALLTAINTAREGYLVTIGVIPHHPETGYGYIERGKLLNGEQPPVYRIAQFREKPPLELAREYLASGLYDWNTGYFAWTLDAILTAFEQYQPTIYAQLSAIAAAIGSADEAAVLATTWGYIERTTIDVGIMEHATNAAVVSSDLGWNDIGSWASLYDILPHDFNDNVIMGDGEHYEIDTQNCLVYSDKRLVVSLGLQDLVIVDTDDALLVLPRDQAQQVSELVKQLRQHKMTNYL